MIGWFCKKMRNRKGFTLIELIVVIAIIGILAAIAVPKLGGFQDSAKERADKASGESVRKAVLTGIASDTFKPGSTNTVIDWTSASDYPISTVVPKADLEKLIEIPTVQSANKQFKLTVEPNGNVTIDLVPKP